MSRVLSLEELRLDYEDFLRQRGLEQWDRADRRRAALIARRPGSGNEVAAWARDVRCGRGGHDGRDGHYGQRLNQNAAAHKSTPSTQSTTSSYAEISANGVLALAAVACSLLDRQLASLERCFVEEGGFTERLYRVRNAKRNALPQKRR